MADISNTSHKRPGYSMAISVQADAQPETWLTLKTGYLGQNFPVSFTALGHDSGAPKRRNYLVFIVDGVEVDIGEAADPIAAIDLCDARESSWAPPGPGMRCGGISKSTAFRTETQTAPRPPEPGRPGPS